MAYSYDDLIQLQRQAQASSSSPLLPTTTQTGQQGIINPNAQPPITAAPVASSGSGSSGSSGSGSPTPGSSSSDVDGSNYVNYSRLYNSNKEKAADMASRAASTVTKEGNQLATDSAKADDEFYSGYNANRVKKYDSGQQVSDGNAFAPGGNAMVTGQSAPAGSITPAEAQARASQSYAGPTGISGYGDLVSRASTVASDANALTTQEGRMGALQGAYGAGSSIDAALAGTAGQGKFDALNTQFGGLGGQIEANQARAQALAGNEMGEANDANALYKGALDRYGAEQADWAKKKADADAAAAQNQKAKSLNDYLKPSAAFGFNTISTLFDPVMSIYQAASGGNKTLEDFGTDYFEKELGHPLGDRHSALPAFSEYNPQEQQKLYDSMTQDEANALEQMSDKDQAAWLAARYQQLGLSGTNQRTDHDRGFSNVGVGWLKQL